MIYTGWFGGLELFPNSLIISGMYKEILTCHKILIFCCSVAHWIRC